MKLRTAIVAMLIAVQLNVKGQEYQVSIEDRNTTGELTNQANKLLEGKKADEAITLLKKAISIDSTYRNSYLCLYKAYITKKDYSDTAVSYFVKANRIFKEDDELHFYLGEIYRAKDNQIDAMNQYTAAIQLSKKYNEGFYLIPSYYVNRGNCYLKMELYDAAIADYNSSLNLKPNNPYALTNRGVCFIKKGETQNACADWEKSAELGNTYAAKYIEKHCKDKTSIQ